MAQSDTLTQRKRPKRANGEGSIYEDGDRVRGAAVATDLLGRRRWLKVSGKSRSEVRETLRQLRASVVRGESTDSTSLGDFLDRWLELEKIRGIRPAIWRQRGAFRPAPPEAQHLRQWLAKLSPSNVEGMMARLMRNG